MSETPVKIIYNCETGEETIIPLTAEEIATNEAAAAEAELQRQQWEAEQIAKQAARESAIAKLSALGLTEEEAAAIVGL
jgi:hypothetical protein